MVEELSMKIMLTDLDKETEKQSLSKIDEQIQEIISLLNQYEKTTLDSFELEKLTSIRKSLDAYGAEHQKALKLAASGQKSIAYTEFSQKAVPLMMDVNTSLNELAEYKSNKADDAKDDAIAGSDMAKRRITIITIIAIIISLLVGLLISKFITNPLVEKLNCWIVFISLNSNLKFWKALLRNLWLTAVQQRCLIQRMTRDKGIGRLHDNSGNVLINRRSWNR